MDIEADPHHDHDQTASRVCLCILMNHPYPRNLPMLREIYLGKFSHLRFLIPFERLDDPDVITVYRGSYNHAGYITDAFDKLQALDCDHFIFCHDDVLLNPQLSERTFRDVFPIGPNDGFISHVTPLPEDISGWAFYLGMVPKLYHPKSLLFGTGVEQSFLRQYLPDRASMEKKLIENGVVYSNEVRLSGKGRDDILEEPAKTVLNGIYTPFDAKDPRQIEIEHKCLGIIQDLIRVMNISVDIAGQGYNVDGGDATVELPIPLANSGFWADLYILPKSRLADYAHYVGVASAANLFVEVMAPTLLLTCCDKVWQADELGLDASGFYRQTEVEAFEDRRFLAIHPLKMAAMGNADKRALLARLRAIAGEPNPRLPVANYGGTDGSLFDIDGAEAQGWHPPGLLVDWSSDLVATVSFHFDTRIALRGLRVQLSIPTHPRLGRLSGAVALNGEARLFSAKSPTTEVEVEFPVEQFRRDGRNLIEVKADQLVRPSDVQPECSQDHRLLGVGLRGLTFF